MLTKPIENEPLYIGLRNSTGATVYVDRPGRDCQPLDPRLDLANHSPTGLEWGYGGSGPAQLALALIADVLDDKAALAAYQEFKWRLVAQLPQERDWCVSASVIEAIARPLVNARTRRVESGAELG